MELRVEAKSINTWEVLTSYSEEGPLGMFTLPLGASPPAQVERLPPAPEPNASGA